jgi:hypothetical protein
MAKSVAVFAGRNGLDFWDVRLGTLRIPEVVARVRQAQRILDEIADLPSLDLFCYIASGDDHFQRNIKLKSLAAAIVQVGLFDRFSRLGRRPNYLLGASNSDPAMMVCSGFLPFELLVRESQALQTLRPLSERPLAPGPGEEAPVLAGISLIEYQALEAQLVDGGGVEWTQVASGFMDFKKIAAKLQEDYEVTNFINIGPANGLLGCGQRPAPVAVSGLDLVVLDSIEMDPLLGWFWRDVRGQSWPIAQ